MLIETDDFMTIPQMMKDSGQQNMTVRNWIRYHNYLPHEVHFERIVVRKDKWEAFKAEHPELINPVRLTKAEEYAEAAMRG